MCPGAGTGRRGTSKPSIGVIRYVLRVAGRDEQYVAVVGDVGDSRAELSPPGGRWAVALRTRCHLNN